MMYLITFIGSEFLLLIFDATNRCGIAAAGCVGDPENPGTGITEGSENNTVVPGIGSIKQNSI